MGNRLDLGWELKRILGSRNAYFQPPPSVQLKYPCAVYELTDINTIYADNNPYRHKKAYQVTIIDKDPDTKLPDEVAKLPMCRFVRFFTANNLNHYVFNIYW